MYKGRLYFSDTSEQTREAALNRSVELASEVGFSGATILRTVGLWNGDTEPGFVLEILHPVKSLLRVRVEQVAALLALEYKQESVLVTLETIDSAVLVAVDGTVESV
jgi:hypothetical protein